MGSEWCCVMPGLPPLNQQLVNQTVAKHTQTRTHAAGVNILSGF
jgi:hypothetical protein